MNVEPKIHTLADGTTLISTSPGHGMKFSDGTSCEPQHTELCNFLTCKRTTEDRGLLGPGRKVELKMILNDAQLCILGELCKKANIVLVPFPVLTALREMGRDIRNLYHNVVAGISTEETARSAPQDKVWHVTKWSY